MRACHLRRYQPIERGDTALHSQRSERLLIVLRPIEFNWVGVAFIPKRVRSLLVTALTRVWLLNALSWRDREISILRDPLCNALDRL